MFLARLLTVAIVVAAGSAVFAVANITLLRPLPFPEGDRLTRVYMQPSGTTEFSRATGLYPLVFQRLQERQDALEAFEGIWVLERAIADEASADSEPGGRVSGGFFDLLGARPHLGRLISHEDVQSGAQVVVLSHVLWQRRFGGDPNVIGRTLVVDREAHAIVGVTSPDFQPEFTVSTLWTPLSLRRPEDFVAFSAIRGIGRLRAGASVEQARSQLAQTMATFQAEAPALLNTTSVGVIDLRSAQYGARRPAMIMLLVAVAGLALIAMANLANLTLADVAARRQDFAIRAALGGSRLALLRPEVRRAVLTAVAGGGLGVVGGMWLAQTLLRLDPTSATAGLDPVLDWRVVATAMASALAVLLVAVVLPVWRQTGGELALAVAPAATRATGSPAARRVRTALVFAQATLGVVLLSASALVATTLRDSAQAPPGFDPSAVVTAQLRLPGHIYPAPVDRALIVDRILERVKAIPGVVQAGTTLNPFTPGGFVTTGIRAEHQSLPEGEFESVQYRRISPGYFAAMGIPLVEGRDFTRQDWIDTPLVAIVSRGYAQRQWPDGRWLGRRVRRNLSNGVINWIEVVGVAGDVRDVGLGLAPADTLYTPYYQGSSPATSVGLVVKAAGDAGAVVPALRQALREVDPLQPLSNIVLLESFLFDSLGQQRFRAALIAVCGLIGLLLATLGTYAVTSRTVKEQRREVGVRLALGGSPLGVWWTSAATSVSAVAGGLVAGAVVSLLVSRALAAAIPEVADASWTFSLAAGFVLLAAGASAALLAARSVVRLDPLRALRD